MNKTVGVLGGGQLGRMFAEAANRLNIKVLILDKENAPAKQILGTSNHIVGSFKDSHAIRQLAAECDVLTAEIEHIDTLVLEELTQSGVIFEPHWRTVATIQDKFDQKQHLKSAGIALADSISLDSGSVDELKRVAEVFDFPFMLKSRREAYDGRGNLPIMSKDDLDHGSDFCKDRKVYAERWAPFKAELAVMAVKTKDGVLSFPTVETVHENSICKLVYAPARNLSRATADKAQQLARKAVAAFEGKGVFGVEMFLLENDQLLINEIAPRPHNSGHYTIESCPISQYDAHLRAILDLPIPPSSLEMREPAVMLNILGSATGGSIDPFITAALSNPRTSIHLYGKGPATTPGRKMGHVTVTAETMAEAEQLIQPLIDVFDKHSGRKPASATPSRAKGGKEVPQIAVIMGSDSDLPTLAPGLTILDTFAIPYTVRITSAHRTPEVMASFVSTAASTGIRVIIAAAGGAAHLPGMAAAYTSLPVIGVPVKASSLDGQDSLYSIVQMPRGVPVATVAIGNSVNAALLAARILGVSDLRVRGLVEEYARKANEEVREKDKRLREGNWKSYMEKKG
ncbi:phosphoribosylaminoimidazole carboxylase [Rhizodiscina lignyota]|uniref:Phosphoribosylaminoimidazole carboxylase n=1 Tax=Rhizodiscina lignyota TaxID=1504668 RepID=A0A9P4M8V0_9PEZI|nr:phosphoribosylaminoimidazole carboxylase [Rhizodiscina lignyota]